MPERSYSLCVCRFPGNSQEHPASSGWVIEHMRKWLFDKRISRVFHLRKSDTPITMVRNELVQKALAENADYILMIDADMCPDCEPDGKPFWDTSWAWMMDRREREEAFVSQFDDDITDGLVTEEDMDRRRFELYPPATIAAPYCGPPPEECVYVGKLASLATGEPTYPRPFMLRLFDREHAASFSGIFQVATLPTGLILYDARVFDHLPQPWYDYEWGDKPTNTIKATTEDFFQTRTATYLSMPQFCNWDAWAGHMKLKMVRKPRNLDISDVVSAHAEAIVKHHRGDHKVVVIRSHEDAPGRPPEIPGPCHPAQAPGRPWRGSQEPGIQDSQ